MSTTNELIAIDAEYEKHIDPNKATLPRILRKELKLMKETIRLYNRYRKAYPNMTYKQALHTARHAAWGVLYPSIYLRVLTDLLVNDVYKEIYNNN